MSAAEVSVDVDMLAELPAKSMLKLIEAKQNVDQFFGQVAAAMKDCAPLFRFFETHDIDMRLDADYCSIGLSFSGTGDRFAEVWAELRRHSFEPNYRPKKGDIEYNGHFTRPGYAKIHLYFTSTQCKRVKVGTKTVEQDVYETQCGDPLPEVEAAPALPAPSEPETDLIPF